VATKNENTTIRPLDDNAAGRVVSDRTANRWEWSPVDRDETARLLRALQNDHLAIERPKVAPRTRRSTPIRTEADVALDFAQRKTLERSGGRDAGGGFNPYENPGKPRRR
jgi:hypothetical protein